MEQWSFLLGGNRIRFYFIQVLPSDCESSGNMNASSSYQIDFWYGVVHVIQSNFTFL